MMPAKFRMSNRGVGQLLNSAAIEAEMLRRARVIQSAAVAISPVGGPGDPHSGAYKSAWYATVQRKSVGRSRKKRPVGVVGNSSYYARWVEYGTERVHAHHVLLRAARLGGH